MQNNETMLIDNFRAFFSGLTNFLKKFRNALVRFNLYNIDVSITLIICILWFLFAYQYGFNNSPDSWYRGVLGKSIIQGHPFYVNLKQGWLYEYGPWHHDATHQEPLLPILYAIFFLIFGNKIIIANLISVFSAGLLIFPLLKLSRYIFKNPWPALLIYCLVISNKNIDFLFEVTAGLSIPTLLLIVVTFLFFLSKILETPNKKILWAAALSLALYYLARAESQIIYFWTMFIFIFISYKIFEYKDYINLRNIWGLSFILVTPWFLRNLFIFKNPFFSLHGFLFWTDRAYDYYSYHENIPLPSLINYFKTHNMHNLLYKIFIKGPCYFYSSFNDVIWGPLWLYIILFIVSIVFINHQLQDNKRKFIFLILWVMFVGYCGVYSLGPMLDHRHFILPFFCLTFTFISALYFLYKFFVEKNKILYSKIVISVFAFLAIFTSFNLWDTYGGNSLKFSFQTSDNLNKQDLLINALIQRKWGKDDIILGPFADFQRLSFATGLTFIEEPDNLKTLNNPIAFFKKYNINYSLINLTNILPSNMIEKVEMAGDKILYTIKRKDIKSVSNTNRLSIFKNSEIYKLINNGIKNKSLYIDAFHGEQPQDIDIYKRLGINIYVSRIDYIANKNKLFQSGLLVLSYAIGKPEMSNEETNIIKQFIANGGRILILCPAWVWTSYEKKGLEHLPYNKIAENYGLLLSSDYVENPLKNISPFGKIINLEEISKKSTFSNIVMYNSNNAKPILIGKDKKVAAAIANINNSKIFIWGQNNLFTSEFTKNSHNFNYFKSMFKWLLE